MNVAKGLLVQNPGTEGIVRAGSSSSGNWLWMLSSGKLWGRHANVDSPASASGPTITAGWHTLVRVWDGQQIRQHVDGRRTDRRWEATSVNAEASF